MVKDQGPPPGYIWQQAVSAKTIARGGTAALR
jgi:hypothetical protein